MQPDQSLHLSALRQAYAQGSLSPTSLARDLHQRAANASEGVWIHLRSAQALQADARALQEMKVRGPLWGIPFAVKDNIDVAGLPTTAACPDYAYIAEHTAPAVQALLDAGALLIGKTNLDQFATGLVGTRSPYGACPNAFDPALISGGSSSGSAVAVASGLVSFALGTDTAGSGRVPAGLNNIVGLKPSLGLLPMAGVVPACRSLDTLSVFALTVEDAQEALQQAGGRPVHSEMPAGFRFGLPRPDQLAFYGEADNARLFEQAVERLQALGGEAVAIDFAPFQAVAELLYEGPWVAERYAAIRAFFDAKHEALLPVTREIIGRGRDYQAADLFHAQYQLEALRRHTQSIMAGLDLMVVPTAPRHYAIEAVQAEPLALNSRLGHYTNFVNLLGYCALSVPAALDARGLPFGITLIAPGGKDAALAGLGARFHQATALPLGATGAPQPARGELPEARSASHEVHLAVVGAHLSGQPLNHQLTTRGARLQARTRTAPEYRLYALPDTSPPKPGLARDPGGAAIEVEVWTLNTQAFGEFVAEVPAPLGIGTLRLADGREVKGFICEPWALAGAEEITAFGGWRAWRAACAELPVTTD